MTSTDLARFDMGADVLKTDPYPTYARYRAADPVHWGHTSLAGYAGAWYLFRHADAIAVLRDPRFGKERKTVTFAESTEDAPAVPEAARTFFDTSGLWIVHRDPPDHTRLRKLLQPYFTASAVAALRPRVAEIAHELLDGLAERGSADLIAELAYPLPVRVITEILGLPDEGSALLVECSRDWQAVDVLTSDETWRRAGASIDRAAGYLTGLVGERRRNPGEDVISAMIAGNDNGILDDEELVANIMFLFVAGAGFQTTTGLIGSALHLLLTNPGQRALLTANWDLAPGAVQEALRYEPPVQATNRIAHEDVEVAGRHIAEGDSVLVMFAAANRDPEVFADPERFDITRPQRANHSFGVGVHYCLGGPLAQLEGEVAVRAVFERFPDLTADGTPEWNPMVSLRVLRALPVRA
ncbi:cytochrome P450 [Actinophytocola sp. KF-1]